MKKKKTIKCILKGVCFSLGFILLFHFFQDLMQAKWTDGTARTTTWQEYRELEKDTVDAIYLGTSHTYSAMDPMYIYEHSGITSFVLAGPGMRFDLTYLVLKDALRTQSPKAVFLDMSSVQFGEQQSETRCHKILDQLPNTKEKIAYALDTDSEELKTLDVLFPLFRYHKRWEQIGMEDFQYTAGHLETPVWRGHYINYRVTKTKYHFYETGTEDSKCHIEGRNLKYLQKIDELCKEQGIQLVMYKIPSPSWYKEQSDGSAGLAQEFGVPFIDLFYCKDEIGMDLETDFRDKKNHLNQSGAEKVSDYIMRYMQENFDLEDRRGKNTRWDQDLITYNEKKAAIASGAVY